MPVLFNYYSKLYQASIILVRKLDKDTHKTKLEAENIIVLWLQDILKTIITETKTDTKTNNPCINNQLIFLTVEAEDKNHTGEKSMYVQ